jgi:glycosyltransferase involved in cell wall biosynthesis
VSALRPFPRLIGKTDSKVVVIFVDSAHEAAVAIRHVRAGGVQLPIYLYCREGASRTVEEQCARVTIGRNSFGLLIRAQRELWPHWVALGISAWTRKPGMLSLKAAPFLFPPFRVLLLNENEDFFPGNATSISTHLRRRIRVATRSGALRVKQVARGLLAYPFAFIAQWFSPLSRLVFERMHGTQSLPLATTRTEGDGIVRLKFRDREWQGSQLEELARSSDARWILIEQAEQEHALPSPSADDMIPLFEDERTFAVSRQENFRGWEKLLFPTAPFRELQPREATQVFAPVSGQILVDRQKLLALGVPKLSGYGSNWYLLFWKAGAAGWCNYSVGRPDGVSSPPLRQVPDVPFYEAQFVHKLLVEPSLAKLKPRDPLLARGNISRRLSGGKGFRLGYTRVLVLSPYLPFPLSHGGAVRMFSLCRALASRVDYVLICFREKNDRVDYDKLHEVFREIHVVGIDELHSNPALPAQVSGYESTSMRALIPEICFKQRIDLLQVEYTQMAGYRETVPHLPAILVEHDITFTLFRQLADREPGAAAESEYKKWLRFERDRLKAFDMIWTMSGYDREQAIAEGAAAERTVVIPNGVDLERYSCGPEIGNGHEILYVGSFRHRPNYLGFEELRRSIMPAVWDEFPDARLVVVAGPDHEKYWPGSREVDPRITVLGLVSDVEPLYRACSVVAVPLPVSAGTNIKLMEALSCQRAVVSTAVGCVGLALRDEEELLVRELGAEFAEGVCRLLRDPGERKAIAARGRQTAELRFGWNLIGENAAAAYETILRPPEARKSLADLGARLVSSNTGA